MSKRCQWMPRVLGSVEWHKGHVTSLGKHTWEMIEIFFQAMGGHEKIVKGWQQCKENMKHCWGHVWGS